MADMISALKALYDALGGTLSNIPDGATNADVIEAIAAQIDEGGGSLPAVTSDDNGDVLTVVEGTWAAAAPSGGGSDIFVVTYTDNSGTVTSDKTLAEIYTAIQAGKAVSAKMVGEGEGLTTTTIYHLEAYYEENHALTGIAFISFVVSGDTAIGVGEIFHASDSITITTGDITMTPVT